MLGDTKYKVSILQTPGSRMVVSSTEIGISVDVEYPAHLYSMWPGHMLEAESDSESDLATGVALGQTPVFNQLMCTCCSSLTKVSC